MLGMMNISNGSRRRKRKGSASMGGSARGVVIAKVAKSPEKIIVMNVSVSRFSTVAKAWGAKNDFDYEWCKNQSNLLVFWSQEWLWMNE